MLLRMQTSLSYLTRIDWKTNLKITFDLKNIKDLVGLSHDWNYW